MTIREELLALGYRIRARLIPRMPREMFIGVRVPEAGKLAKRLIRKPEAADFTE